ncbi:hypothetical protein N7510_009939 [Penicillium lagena]|uniref:uncharacterized protein n=1 Tax=Penicillium lagena TaxID=94218 RepID=UPI002541A008|nr:uncharacterized protein N7510_009939 [Penicillium lagena]KAJ5604785.1 hypothetical protein N7510_009939 [Penicillium lagena]
MVNVTGLGNLVCGLRTPFTTYIQTMDQFVATIGEEVTDAEEEAFLLFAQDIPSANLGFVDSRAATVDLVIGEHEYCIHQSPTLLSSSRAGGTTGAVLWKITPLFAKWISSPSNPLWTHSLLSAASVVAELGCGISALLALTLAPAVQHYVATDQEYVRRLFRTNLDANAALNVSSSSKSKGSTKTKGRPGQGKKQQQQQQKQQPAAVVTNNITFTTLDWELDQPELLKSCIESDNAHIHAHAGEEEEDKGFDLLLSCDCIYNDALITPFVRTCADLCRLRPGVGEASSPKEPLLSSSTASSSPRNPTICIVAQQQRSPEVFEAWLRETLREFRVWRVSNEVLGEGLCGGTGFVVHLLLVRNRHET